MQITGYNPHIERSFDYGVVGGLNTYTLPVDKAIDKNEVEVLDELGREFDQKLLYVHPGQLPIDRGTQLPAFYSGEGRDKHRSRKVDDSAALLVEEEFPANFVKGLDFSDINSVLIGDSMDKMLEGERVMLQVYPSYVSTN
ncbi:MAG: hypothetical protein ACLFTA_02460 [Candidatus Nanohaloarchaea archaeon]